jgi:hypothetical protein
MHTVLIHKKKDFKSVEVLDSLMGLEISVRISVKEN